MKTITIDGVEYNLTPIKKTEAIILEQHLKFEVYPEDLGQYSWNYAKIMCAELGDGWRLPTKEELNLMYLNRGAIGGFAAAYYWSSSEFNYCLAWNQFFNYGNQYHSNKNYTYFVRAVRSLSI